MKTKILGVSIFLFAMFLTAGTVCAGDSDWLQPASMTFDEPVDVNSSLKVTQPTYFIAGMHVGQQVVGGVSYLQGTIINTTTHNGQGVPVTIGDDLRVDGRITRGYGPVIVDDDLWVTKNIKMNPGMTVDGVDISALRITDWNAAFGWGNHALQGYLTTEVDPIFTPSAASGIADADITNWNTAYGWGNHAAAGYLTTESDPLAVLKTDYTASGDLLYGTGAGTYTDLSVGSNGQVLTVVAGVPSWSDTGRLTGSKTWDPSPLSLANLYRTTNVTVTGASPGDTCVASHTGFGVVNLLVSCQISANNTAMVLIKKQAALPLIEDLPSGTLNVDVWTH